jgi:threonine/homoserine/homoserine lactone efflux protein
MIAFVRAVFLLIITPGPGVLSTAGVGAAFSWRQGLFYVAGLCVGTNTVSTQLWR